MSRTLLALAAFTFVAPQFAQPKDPPPKLKIGDPAPPLVADKWLVGKEVKGFEKDTVYLVSFTSFSPSSASTVLALSEFADQFAGKGLVVVSVNSIHTAKGSDLSDKQLEKYTGEVTALAKEWGVTHPVVWNVNRKEWDYYVGVPPYAWAFVIDKAGKVAYFGSEAVARHAAAKVLDGTWKGKADADATNEAVAGFRKYTDELGKKVGSLDKFDDKAIKTLQDGLPALEKLFKDAPFLLTTPEGWMTRFVMHTLAKSYDVPDEILTARLAAAAKRKSKAVLTDLGYQFAGVPFPADPKLSKLAAKFLDAYAGLLDAKKAGEDPRERDQWLVLIAISAKYTDAARTERYAKTLLDALPEGDRKGIEGIIRETLKNAGGGK